MLLHPIEVCRFLAVFCQSVLYVMGSLLQFVRSQIRLLTVKSVARSVNDAFAGFYEFLLFSLKYAPPDYIGMLAVLVGRETMKCATHIVQRQHAVFSLYILHNCAPMFVIVELRTQNFKTETECPCLFVYLIYNLYLASSDLILVVDETSQDVTTKGETVVVVLQDGTKLSVFHIVFELYPDRIVGIVEECGGSRSDDTKVSDELLDNLSKAIEDGLKTVSGEENIVKIHIFGETERDESQTRFGLHKFLELKSNTDGTIDY